MKIRCDNYSYGLLDEPGDQPIRIFYPHLQSQFEEINEELKGAFPHLPNIRLSFLTENIACIGPSCTPAKIEIHDTFLSMVWGIIYGVLINAPIRDDKTELDGKAAEELLAYSLRLLSEYSEWDKIRLPNPELHEKDSKHLIGKSNIIFWCALNFIINHEFAHIALGHFDSENQLSSLDKEYEADSFAMTQLMAKYKNSIEEPLAQMGVISALSAILYCTYDAGGGSIHPDPHHRLSKVLEKLDQSKNKGVFVIAMWFIIDWGMKFNAYWKLWPGKFSGNMKQAYNQSLFYLENLQKEREVVIPDMDKDYSIGEEVILLDNGVPVTIVQKVAVSSKHFNVYEVEFGSGFTNYVSSDDIARKGSEMDLLVREWKQEMEEAEEKSLSIAVEGMANYTAFSTRQTIID